MTIETLLLGLIVLWLILIRREVAAVHDAIANRCHGQTEHVRRQPPYDTIDALKERNNARC